MLFQKGEKKTGGRVPLVLDFHPNLSNVGSIMRRLYSLLDLQTKAVFKACRFTAFRSPRNLRSHLVKAKVTVGNERKKGCKKCGSVRCLTCNNLKETYVFSSSVTKCSYRINHQLDCNSKNIVYLLSCKVCELQYVGQISDKFRFRWNNYKTSQKKAVNGVECPQWSFHQPFLGQGHNGLLNDFKRSL